MLSSYVSFMYHYVSFKLFVALSKRIGFVASSSTYSNSWKSGTLVISVDITNVGNGYNSSTGIFRRRAEWSN